MSATSSASTSHFVQARGTASLLGRVDRIDQRHSLRSVRGAPVGETVPAPVTDLGLAIHRTFPIDFRSVRKTDPVGPTGRAVETALGWGIVPAALTVPG